MGDFFDDDLEDNWSFFNMLMMRRKAEDAAAAAQAAAQAAAAQAAAQAAAAQAAAQAATDAAVAKLAASPPASAEPNTKEQELARLRAQRVEDERRRIAEEAEQDDHDLQEALQGLLFLKKTLCVGDDEQIQIPKQTRFPIRRIKGALARQQSQDQDQDQDDQDQDQDQDQGAGTSTGPPIAPELLSRAYGDRGSNDKETQRPHWNQILEQLCQQTRLYTYHDHSTRPVLCSNRKVDGVFAKRDQLHASFGNAVILARLEPDFEGGMLKGLSAFMEEVKMIREVQHVRERIYVIYGNLQQICLFLLDMETGIFRTENLDLLTQKDTSDPTPGPGLLLLQDLVSLDSSALGFHLPWKVQEKMELVSKPTLIAQTPLSVVIGQGDALCFKFTSRVKEELDILTRLRKHDHILKLEPANLSLECIAAPIYFPIPDGAPPATYYNFSQQIYSALRHTHQGSFYHRDVCPHNIMMVSPDKAVLLGWGYSVEDGGLEDFVWAREVVGSLLYLSLGQLNLLAKTANNLPVHQNMRNPSFSPRFAPSRDDFECLFSTLVFWLAGKKVIWKRTFDMDQANRPKFLSILLQDKANFFLRPQGGLEQLVIETDLPQLLKIRDQLYSENLKRKEIFNTTMENLTEEPDVFEISDW